MQPNQRPVPSLQRGIEPGPCPPGGCPPPDQIACIETNLIYDSCFLSDEREQTGTIPLLQGGFDPDADYTVDCDIQDLTCDEIDRTPVNDEGNNTYNVSLRVQYTVQVTITQNGTMYFQGTLDDVYFRTTRLTAPDGTTVECSSLSTMGCRAFVLSLDADGANVQVNAALCLIVRSFATVQLLVPSYGFAVPPRGRSLPINGTPCPPNMFPPTGNTFAGRNR